MRVTVDTNILFHALYSRTGASHQILKMIRNGDISLAISIPVYKEYQDVMKRKRTLEFIKKSEEDIDIVLEFIALVGEPFVMNYLWRPNLRDEKDNIFTELAFNSGSKYLITKNIKDFTIDSELILDSFEIISPSDFLSKWRSLNEKK
jgi:putative PIN family toxin of toxin-antitoxin system